ncbi:hypothetical protein AX16_005267 [Volvariella volvacea WC 439]|nr:hypothetical protein AX16_005267 [Volvariella volvacea WC 439]
MPLLRKLLPPLKDLNHIRRPKEERRSTPLLYFLALRAIYYRLATYNAIGDTISAISNSQVVAIAQSGTLDPVFALAKDKISNFVENTKILVDTLDEIAKVHPFIDGSNQIGDNTPRERCTGRSLYTTMCDAMGILTSLKRVVSSKDLAPGVEERLHVRLGKIIESIKNCAKLCDSYQRRHTAIKLFTSIKWQYRFTDAANEFIEHKNALQSDLQIYISIQVTNVNETLATINGKIDEVMAMIFKLMITPEELEVAAFIRGKGGLDAVLKDDTLLQQVMLQDGQQKNRNNQILEQESNKSQLSEFRKDVEKEVDDILKEGSTIFDRKFEAIRISLQEVKVTVQREGDRVVEEIVANIHAGPHERIKDRELYAIWRDMGWKGSVKTTRFVLAVHDYFYEKANINKDQVNPSTPEEKAQGVEDVAKSATSATPLKDIWALKLITIKRIQSLIEAVDEDGSEFITVTELNAFTYLKWIAYWTYGFEMSTQWYHRRICRKLSSITKEAAYVLPANRKLVNSFLGAYPMVFLSRMLVGLRNVNDWNYFNWNNDKTFLEFKDWILENEKRMKTFLRRVSYLIDGDNILTMATDGGRPEKYVMPILYLLLERSLWIITCAQEVTLDQNELEILNASFYTVSNTVLSRIIGLKSWYALQNLNQKDKLQKAFFGLWSYVFDDYNWDIWSKFTFRAYYSVLDEDTDNLDTPEPPLFYKAKERELLDDFADHRETENMIPASNEENETTMAWDSRSVVGSWSGEYTYYGNMSSDGLVSFEITSQEPGGHFKGFGKDPIGAFSIEGKVVGGVIGFRKEYNQEGKIWSWDYRGNLHEDGRLILGRWGYPIEVVADDDASQMEETTPELNIPELEIPEFKITDITITEFKIPELKGTSSADAKDSDATYQTLVPGMLDIFSNGNFVLHRRPADHWVYCPSEEEFEHNRIHALWKLVRNASKYWYRRKHITWDGIVQRRGQRRRYEVFYWKQKNEMGFVEHPERDKLVQTTHPDDLHLWRAIAEFKARRRPAPGQVQHHPLQCMKTDSAHSTYCSNCGKGPLKNTQFCCVTCSGSPGESLDLCTHCMSKDVYRKLDNKYHYSSHPLLQLRRGLIPLEFQPLRAAARQYVEVHWLPGTCHYCGKEIKSRPYWVCLECTSKPILLAGALRSFRSEYPSNVLVCNDCNVRREEKKEWLLDQRPAHRDLHDDLHTLVLIINQSDVKKADSGSTELQLKNVEEGIKESRARFESFEDFVNTRLQRIEDTLQRVLAALAQRK